MMVRRLDPETGDIITSGPDVFARDREAVAQTIKTRLALYLGEYFRNIKDGTPWYEQILGKFANLNTVESVLRARIANSPEVVRITAFGSNFDPVTRKYSVSAQVMTTYGLAEIELNG